MGRATEAYSAAFAVFVLVAAGAASATSAWPDCVENAEYTGGFDFVAGYRSDTYAKYDWESD